MSHANHPPPSSCMVALLVAVTISTVVAASAHTLILRTVMRAPAVPPAPLRAAHRGAEHHLRHRVPSTHCASVHAAEPPRCPPIRIGGALASGTRPSPTWADHP